MTRRQRDTEATRRALLNAATELFAQYGFEGTTVERIARKAGANKAMISYHFGGKRKLYMAILQESFAAAGKKMGPVRDSSLPAEERLREFIRAFGELVAERPHFPTMMAREAISGGRNMDARIFPHLAGVYGGVREAIEQGIREGSFQPVDPILFHLGLIGSLVFFFSTDAFRRRLLSGRGFGEVTIDPDRYIRHLQDWVVRGLARRPVSGPVVVCEPPATPRSKDADTNE